MSDLDEVPKLSAEATEFLVRHAATGEPAAEALARVGEKLLAAERPAAPKPATPRRSWLPNEVMAAAAVLLLLLGAQGLYWYFRAPAPVQSPEVTAVVEAYRAGDLEGARVLASQHCADAACKPLASSLSQALGLSKRLDALSPGELEQLATLDAQLGGGAETALGLRIAQRTRGAGPVVFPTGARLAEAEALFEEANTERRARNYELAARRLEKCTRIAPAYHPCYRLLGSVYASIAARDQSVADNEKARAAYQRFLEVAPPDDSYVPRVTAILEAAGPGEDRAPGPAVDEPAGSPGAAGPGVAPVSSSVDRDQIRELYLRGYILKESEPEAALKLFKQVMALTPPEDDNHQKAKVWVAELSAAGSSGEFVGESDGEDPVPGPPEEILVKLNTTLEVPFAVDIERVAIGDAAVADVRVTGRRTVLLNGTSPGKTTLLVWMAGGQRKSQTIVVR